MKHQHPHHHQQQQQRPFMAILQNVGQLAQEW